MAGVGTDDDTGTDTFSGTGDVWLSKKDGGASRRPNNESGSDVSVILGCIFLVSDGTIMDPFLYPKQNSQKYSVLWF